MQQKVVVIGAGGHAKVVADIVIKNKDILLGFLDDNINLNVNIVDEYSILGKIEECIKIHEKDEKIKFVIAIGNNITRSEIAQKYMLPYYNAIHPTATIGMNVEIKEGTVVMAHTSINSNAKIGKHCIINTGSIVEHDNIISDFVHISPKVALGGTVRVGEKTHIGIGATIRNNINIGDNIVIGAGAVVVKNIEKQGTYMGVPAKII